ncbi:hypothetical protein GPECTOR_47g350 [Gonium pectorale]|uniref:Endonuclease/exonuclease/phosphatase domain-containing protein n=1 Tax=Gonium pectorale TaxID=33097 RepID=A0A150G945_GONPE|nr:hypothetical protein GPECTOR_47g350 [Gonium pectorale]|eukprot:KXZ46075.1 hypothetical protein GPECTOR_47g350 [Gonium pectorale]
MPPAAMPPPAVLPATPLSSRERPAGVLRLGTHNIGGSPLGRYGLNGKSSRSTKEDRLPELLATWRAAELDVVCVQETRLVAAKVDEATEVLLRAGWQSFWCPAREGGIEEDGTPGGKERRPAGGVGILIRSELYRSGAVRVLSVDEEVSEIEPARFLLLDLEWGGHTFKLLSLHLRHIPQLNKTAALHGWVTEEELAPLAAQDGMQIWAGDFNSVANRSPDIKGREGDDLSRTRLVDSGIANRFTRNCEKLVDVWRHLHVSCKPVTHYIS